MIEIFFLITKIIIRNVQLSNNNVQIKKYNSIIRIKKKHTKIIYVNNVLMIIIIYGLKLL